MPRNPFTTYNSNERDVHIPVTPTQCTTALLSAATTTVCGSITLSPANVAALLVHAYIYYVGLFSGQTGAASGLAATFQFQFRNAAHVNVGAAIGVFQLIAGCNGAGAAGVLNTQVFAPAVPWHQQLTIPATAAEVILQRVANIAGVPSVTSVEMWGIDLINTGVPGDIGSGGMVAQSTTNPNTF